MSDNLHLPWARGVIEHDAVVADDGHGCVLVRSCHTLMTDEQVDYMLKAVRLHEPMKVMLKKMTVLGRYGGCPECGAAAGDPHHQYRFCGQYKDCDLGNLLKDLGCP